MIEKIDLSNTELTGNYLIVKPDPNYDFVQVKGVDGQVKIYLGYNPQDETKHVSISGTVLLTPKNLKYYKEILDKDNDMSQDEKSSKMRNSMQFKTKLNVKTGDKIYFNYHNQFQAEDEGRLVEVKDHGYCMLMNYETLYGKQVKDEFVPLNGYAIFKRDQSEREYKTASGLYVVQNVDVYSGKMGEVICADDAVTGYLDGGYEDQTPLKKGDQVLLNPKFGYRIAYSIHAGDLQDYEITKRRYIFGIIDKSK